MRTIKKPSDANHHNRGPALGAYKRPCWRMEYPQFRTFRIVCRISHRLFHSIVRLAGRIIKAGRPALVCSTWTVHGRNGRADDFKENSPLTDHANFAMANYRCRRSNRFSSRASNQFMDEPRRYKPADSPFWQAARPSPRPMCVLPVLTWSPLASTRSA